MTLGWKNLGLQARFMVLAGAGVLTLAIVAIALISWFEFANFRKKVARLLGERTELAERAGRKRDGTAARRPAKRRDQGLQRLVREPQQGVSGKLWSVWSPKVTAYMAKTAPERRQKCRSDSIDQEALRTGQPMGASSRGLPLKPADRPRQNLAAPKEICDGCHAGTIGLRDGDVISVFSSSLSTAEDFAALRRSCC